MRNQWTVVGFGDSITEAQTGIEHDEDRYLEVLHHLLSERFPETIFQVVNAGVGGNSTREAMQRLERDVLTYAPDWVLLELGGNNHDFRNPSRVVPLTELQTALEQIRTKLPPPIGLAIVTFPPILDDLHCYTPLHLPELEALGGLDRAMEPHRAATRRFAWKYGLPLIDLDAEIRRRSVGEGRLAYTQPDGVHLNIAGNRLLAEMAFHVLAPAFGK